MADQPAGPGTSFEVLIEERVRPLRAAGSSATGVRILDQDLQARRRQALDRACGALDSERYRRLGLRVALWLAQGRWAQDDDPLAIARRERPAPDFAAEVLGKRMKKIAKKIRKLDALSARDRHRLRIEIKKLRYAAEFFAGFFGGRKRGTRRRRVNKILKDLQASLGTLNDIEVHKHLAKTVISSEQRRAAASQESRGVVRAGVYFRARARAGRFLPRARRQGRKTAFRRQAVLAVVAL